MLPFSLVLELTSAKIERSIKSRFAATDANLPNLGKVDLRLEDAAKGNQRGSFLITASAAIITAPAIVRIDNIMPARKVVSSFQGDYHHGFFDRLWFDKQYRSGQLSDSFLVRMALRFASSVARSFTTIPRRAPARRTSYPP